MVAVGELARTEEALHAGAQLDLVDGGGAADELGLVGDRLHLGGLDEHGGGRRALLGPGRRRADNAVPKAPQREASKPSNAALALSSSPLVP